MAEPVLYRWPANAAFGRMVPKTKFYEHGKVGTALRQKFVDNVQRITWAYKLADSTVHLGASATVPEIQVFMIDAKGDDVTDDVLAAIDRSVHFPIIFEVAGTGRVRMVAAQKILSVTAPRVGPYFTTGWQPVDAPRRPLPTALDLSSLYEAVLTALLPLRTRVGETMSDATDRMNQTRKLQREIALLEKKMRTEPQLNRKIELRKHLKERQTALFELIDPAPSTRG